MKHRAKNQERGVALIMVIFMVVLCSALLVSLSDSTYTAMRVNRITEQRVKAEYILKSAVNFARVLIQKDQTQLDDPINDDWMQFQDGREVPGELVGINEPNVKISLLIAPENGKIPLTSIIDRSTSMGDPLWSDIIYKLFVALGFDNPPTNPNNTTSGTAQPFVTCTEMIGNLIDYLDIGTDSYSIGVYRGDESNRPQGAEYPNKGEMESLQSLTSITGFTPQRVQQLLPYVFVPDKNATAKISISSAPVRVLSALIQGVDPNFDIGLADAEAEKLIQCREPANGGPYGKDPSVPLRTQISQCSPNVPAAIANQLTVQTSLFSVIAKVEYGNAAFFASAQLKAKPPNLPEIREFVVY